MAPTASASTIADLDSGPMTAKPEGIRVEKVCEFATNILSFSR